MSDPTAPAGPGADTLTVLYDGACPLCRREIALYRDLPARAPLCFADVSDGATPLPDGAPPRDTLLARFHVQRADGTLLHGAAAFVALWARLPGWRWLAVLARLPGATAAMEAAYRGFLRVRPAMQRLARAFEVPGVPADLVADLRSDHAGETGAVWIYRGIALVTRDAALRDFAHRHGATEADHLRQVEAWLPRARRSWLLPGWRVAGFLTGALPALAGPRAVHTTIAAVETFVDHHYQAQLDKLQGRDGVQALADLLRTCQADEVAHRDEARALLAAPPGRLLRAWCALVGSGSAAAVHLARRV